MSEEKLIPTLDLKTLPERRQSDPPQPKKNIFELSHVDAPKSSHVDAPQPSHINAPKPSHVDSPQPSHVDAPKNVDSPKNVDAPQHFDSPRPNSELFLRRRSQGNARKPLSPLRKSQTELCMSQHLKDQTKTTSKPATLQTQSESLYSDVFIKPIVEKAHLKESPPFGRLESYPANFYLLEQVIRSPGGGIELRTVLGIYTSKSAANRAAQWYIKENPNSLHQCDNTVELVTSQMPIDKTPTGNHSHETVEI